MELNQVRYFITLSRLLNFTRAAEACEVSQPALTRAIQRLETELGGALIYRERNRTQLTELGRQVRPHLENMLMSAEAATNLAAERLAGPQRTLTIGTPPGIGAARIAGALREVARVVPDLVVEFMEDDPAALSEAMLADEIHCALLPREWAEHDRFHRWHLYTDSAQVILPADCRLASYAVLDAGNLVDETLLSGGVCSYFAERLCAEADVGITVRKYQGSLPRLFELVEAGFGLGVVADSILLPPTLVARKLRQPQLQRHVALAVVSGRPHDDTLSTFVKLCRASSGLQTDPVAN